MQDLRELCQQLLNGASPDELLDMYEELKHIQSFYAEVRKRYEEAQTAPMRTLSELRASRLFDEEQPDDR